MVTVFFGVLDNTLYQILNYQSTVCSNVHLLHPAQCLYATQLNLNLPPEDILVDFLPAVHCLAIFNYLD